MNEFNQNENFEDVELSKDSFELVQSNTKIFDQKFETKATTYFKDALKRFRKNKMCNRTRKCNSNRNGTVYR